MNILIIDNSIAFTGAIKCAVNEAELLSDHKFIFVIPEKSTLKALLTDKGFKVYTLPMMEIRKSLVSLFLYLPTLLRNNIRLNKILAKEAIDVIQVNDFYNLLGGMSKRARFKGKLITYVRFLPSVIPSILRNAWISFAVKHSSKVVAVSDAVLNQLPKEKNVTRIYDPVKLEEKYPAKVLQDNKTIQLLYLSNYIQGKGQDDSIEAFAAAYTQNPALRLKLVGGDMGLEKNIAYKTNLQNKVNSLGLTNVVEFALFNADVEQEIKQADIVLNFSKAESFSMTCLETAFYGTPLIATRCGGPEEIINDKQTGLLVPVGDIPAMTEAILTLANNFALRASYATAAKSYVREKFSTEKFKQQFENILNTSNA